MTWFNTLIYILGWISFVILILIILLFLYVFIQSKITYFKLRKRTEESMREKQIETKEEIKIEEPEPESIKLDVIEEKQEGEKIENERGNQER